MFVFCLWLWDDKFDKHYRDDITDGDVAWIVQLLWLLTGDGRPSGSYRYHSQRKRAQIRLGRDSILTQWEESFVIGSVSSYHAQVILCDRCYSLSWLTSEYVLVVMYVWHGLMYAFVCL